MTLRAKFPMMSAQNTNQPVDRPMTRPVWGMGRRDACVFAATTTTTVFELVFRRFQGTPQS